MRHFIKILQAVWALFTCGQLDGCDGNDKVILDYIFLIVPKKDKGFSS
jgi:hypothetical protein